MIKSLEEFTKKIDFMSLAENAILEINSINNDNIFDLLPDLRYKPTLEQYLMLMPKLKKTKDFVNYIENNKDKKYCIIGDYDNDGIFATVIMVMALNSIGVNVTYVCPNRFIHGYGLSNKLIDIAIQSECSVIITVDNGITTLDAINYAHDNGLDVIVTDHHRPQDENPADIVIDPFYDNEDFAYISGATVAMKLAYGLYQKFNFSTDIMLNLAALAGITVISDSMKLLNENRLLFNASMEHFKENIKDKNSFCNRLCNMLSFYNYNNESDPYLNIDGTFKDFTVNNIGFYFVPVINAVNRVVGDVNDLVYDILNLFYGDYNGIPKMYYNLNRTRKFMTSSLLLEHKKNNLHAVVEVLEPGYYAEYNYAGIVGLVASNIVENENKPALIGLTPYTSDTVKLSGRSVPGFNLFNALDEIKKENPDLSLNFGGHSEALGASCKLSEIETIEKLLSEKFEKASLKESEQTYFELDKNNYKDFIDAYRRLYPFGNSFIFPKLRYTGKLIYINTNERYFSISGLPGIQIKYFNKSVENSLFEIIKSKKETDFVLEILDEDNRIFMKLFEIL